MHPKLMLLLFPDFLRISISSANLGAYESRINQCYWVHDVPRIPKEDAARIPASATSFQADETGTYVVTLMVEDENGAWSDASHVVITISDGQAPVADAGADATGSEGETLTLDGTDSFDPMGRDLSYSWAFQAVPTTSALTSLTGFDSAAPSFVADVGGVYIVSLTVDNGVAESSPDTLVARISSADPQAPIALAGRRCCDRQRRLRQKEGSARICSGPSIVFVLPDRVSKRRQFSP